MVAQIGNLQVRVGADITGLTTGMRRAQREVAQSAAGMKRSTRDMELTFKEVATFSSRLFRTGALAFGGAFGAQAILGATDAFKQMTAQLKLATSQFGSFAQANKDVREISEKTRSDLLSTSALYSSLQRNADQFGATQAQVARVTQTVAEAFKISGASADEASNATRQLVQAFQSGRLQGDEFRSVLENAPRLARLLADSLGTTIGALRNMSKEGKLTSDILVRAFSDRKFTEGLDQEFQQLPVTFDQAMSQVKNAAILALGAFDQGGQFSTSLANFITDGVKGFGDLEGAAYKFGQAVSDLSSFMETIHEGIGSLRTDGIGSFAGLTDATLTWRDALAGTLGVIDGVANAAANLYNAPGNTIRTALGKPIIYNPVNLRGQFIERTNRDHTNAFLRQLQQQEIRPPKPTPSFRPTGIGGGGAKRGRTARAPRDRSEDVAYQFDQEQRRADQQILSAKQQLVSNSDERAKIELQMIELEKQTSDAEIDHRISMAKKNFAEHRITESALKEVTAQAGILKQKNDEEARLKAAAVVQEQLHQKQEDAANLVQVDFELQQDALKAQEQLATTAKERREIELQLLDLSYRQEKARLDAVLADEQSSEAAKEEARRRLAGLNANYATNRQGVINSTMGPLEQFANDIPKTADKINEAFQSIEVQGLDSLSDAIADVVTGAKSLKDAFSEVAKSIITDIIQMTVKMLIFRAISGLFGGSPVPTLSNVTPVTPFHFAHGGSFTIGGRGGVDNNIMSLNGLPIANVSKGERVNIGNDNTPGGKSIVEVHVKTDENFTAQVAQVAGAVVTVFKPSIVKDARAATVKSLTRRSIAG
jgi:tape measure domain-containing protein